MRILWISPYAPYDTVGHAGGQNHNFYLKYMKTHTEYDITLLTVCEQDEVDCLDLDLYEIDSIVKVCDKRKCRIKIQSSFGKLLWFRDGGLLEYPKYLLLKEAIGEYACRTEIPDVIITQWTEATLLYDIINKYFPTSLYIAIEEDVAFLGFQRKYEQTKGVYRAFKKKKYDVLKQKELAVLNKCRYIVVLNDKDRKLLTDNGIHDDKVVRLCSYYHNYQSVKYNPNVNQLLFYGAMGRKENNESVLWFIDNVMPKLDEKFKLVVVGSNPSEKLEKMSSERIVIKGFVEDITPYFGNSLCLVAPLVLGGGIKIKVLEALSAGLPVLTNAIGAEGINLVQGYNYVHCEDADSYVESINELSVDEELRTRISVNGRSHVSANFNSKKELMKLVCLINKYKQ